MDKTSKTKWERLSRMRDKDIDTGDIRQLGRAFFQKAKVRPPAKRSAAADNAGDTAIAAPFAAAVPSPHDKAG